MTTDVPPRIGVRMRSEYICAQSRVWHVTRTQQTGAINIDCCSTFSMYVPSRICHCPIERVSVVVHYVAVPLSRLNSLEVGLCVIDSCIPSAHSRQATCVFERMEEQVDGWMRGRR